MGGARRLPTTCGILTIAAMHRKPPAEKPASPLAFVVIAGLFVVGAASVELLDDSKDVAAGQSSESLIDRIRQSAGTPEQRQALSQASPAQLRALMAQATPEQLRAMAAQASPEQLQVLVNQASREQLQAFGGAASAPVNIDRAALMRREEPTDDTPALATDRVLTQAALQRPGLTASANVADNTGLKADLEDVTLARAVSFDSTPPDRSERTASFCDTRRDLEDPAWQAHLVDDRAPTRMFRRPPSFQLSADCGT